MHNLRLPHTFCVSIALMGLVSSAVPGANITFSGGGPDNSWLTGANWSPTGSPPANNDLALITNSLQAVEVNASGAVARNIDVRNGGVLNVTGGDLTFGFSSNRWMWVGFLTPGTVNQSGGTVTGTGSFTDLVIDRFGEYNMTGGTLNLSDDIWLLDGAEFEVGGQSNINVGDDLRIPFFSSTTFSVNLVGNQEPTIVIGDDLIMRGDLHLDIDTSAWTGGTEFDLFQVNDGIIGQLASLTIDGIPQDPNSIRFENGTVVVPLNEPTGGVLAGIAMFFMVLSSPLRRRHLKPHGQHASTATLQRHHAPRTSNVDVRQNPT